MPVIPVDRGPEIRTAAQVLKLDDGRKRKIVSFCFEFSFGAKINDRVRKFPPTLMGDEDCIVCGNKKVGNPE